MSIAYRYAERVRLTPEEARLAHYRAELVECERECVKREACQSTTAAYWKRKRQGWARKIYDLLERDLFTPRAMNGTRPF